MARTSDPHAAAVRAWDTRGRHGQPASGAGDRKDQIDQENARLLGRDEVRTAIKVYVSSASNVNKYLRHNVPVTERAMDAAEELLKTLPKSRLPEDTTLYRGIRQKGLDAIGRLVVGDIFEDKGVVSTSEDSGVGAEFSEAGGAGYLIRIRARQGQRGLPIARRSKYDRTAMIGLEMEQETLLPPGSRFRITKVSTRPETISMPIGKRQVKIIDMDLLD